MALDRRDFLKLGLKSGGALAALTVFAGFSPSFAASGTEEPASTLILDADTQQWVPYTRARARRYFKAKGQVPGEFLRQTVPFRTTEKPGTVIIDANQHFLYFVQENNTAIRYGIGVGRDGFGWAGIVNVGRKAEWPRWTPPAEMVARDPLAAKWAKGMPGGPNNPLGARAIYLYEGNRDTIYRIHGTIEPWSIGLNISSGCIRMVNDDVIDLHNRIKVGAKVIVLKQNASILNGV